MSDTTAHSKARSRPVLRSPYVVWGLAALIQLALISFPLIERLQVQMTGTVVPLELVPVDPRDLPRGDYVVINLAIGRIGIDVPGSGNVTDGQKIYVGLEAGEGGGPYRPVVVAEKREDAGDIAIAGEVRYIGGDHLRLDYGIDAFFLPEGEGRQIERMDSKRLLLNVSVAPDGKSLPVALLVDGKAIRSDGIF